jgi:hypothetical protein
MPRNYFGEHIAARYDDTSDDMFEPAQVNPVADFLAALATDGTLWSLVLALGVLGTACTARHSRPWHDLSEAMVGRLVPARRRSDHRDDW